MPVLNGTVGRHGSSHPVWPLTNGFFVFLIINNTSNAAADRELEIVKTIVMVLNLK